MLELNILVYVFVASLALSIFLVVTQNIHGTWTNDPETGIQKIHQSPTSRIGGLSLIVSLALVYFFKFTDFPNIFSYILISSLPIVFAGLLEDLTKKINPFYRFISAIFSSILFINLTGYYLNPFSIFGVDYLISNYLISILFTVFCIVGVTNSINIIDGFNGLASGSIIIMMSAFSYIAWYQGDNLMLALTTIFIASNLGFLFLNFPYGKIFLGDGGAYFSGFYLAITAILFSERNIEISPWVSFLICSYPIIETLVSIYRKTLRKGHHFSKPDRLHLHMLVYRDLARNLSRKLSSDNLRNPTTTIIMLAFPSFFCLFACIFYTNLIIIYILIATAFYVYIRFYKHLSFQKK